MIYANSNSSNSADVLGNMHGSTSPRKAANDQSKAQEVLDAAQVPASSDCLIRSHGGDRPCAAPHGYSSHSLITTYRTTSYGWAEDVVDAADPRGHTFTTCHVQGGLRSEQSASGLRMRLIAVATLITTMILCFQIGL